MARIKTVYVCTECGHEHPKWQGQCAGCGGWNTLSEFTPEPALTSGKGFSSAVSGGNKLTFKQLKDISFSEEPRFDTGMAELNRVLGGGLVKGSLVLLSGDPGIGKSTLLLQICGDMCKTRNVLYVSGEESARQIKLRSERLGITSERLQIAATTDCAAVVSTLLSDKPHMPDILIIDSIQTMVLGEIQSAAGSVTQVRECTALLMRLAKTEDIAIFIVGHVNKDGGVAGPKVLEHIVDTVLYFEGEKRFSYRILRAEKNRFGSTNEIGVFEMGERGLTQVQNPSAMLLSGRPAGVAGISVIASMEGSRPILAEVQALVAKTGFSAPRRVADGFDYNRLCLIIAVLEKRTGFLFSGCDVYVNIVGGLKIDEPAADLSVAMALYSGLCDISLPEGLLLFGEIGLGGELRGVSHTRARLREGAALGFKTAVIPKASLRELDKSESFAPMRIIGAANLQQAMKAAVKEDKTSFKQE